MVNCFWIFSGTLARMDMNAKRAFGTACRSPTGYAMRSNGSEEKALASTQTGVGIRLEFKFNMPEFGVLFFLSFHESLYLRFHFIVSAGLCALRLSAAGHKGKSIFTAQKETYFHAIVVYTKHIRTHSSILFDPTRRRFLSCHLSQWLCSTT